MREFIIADTHFFHESIISYENRPFDNVEKMNKTLIQNWNNTVCKQDRVYVLGDFMFHAGEHVKEVVEKLNGRKFLIKGNHDTLSSKTYTDAGFYEVSSSPIIIRGFIILLHEPLYLGPNIPYINMFGHVHSDPMYAPTKQRFCASVERAEMQYKPITVETALGYMSI